jgi:hypothetical protein
MNNEQLAYLANCLVKYHSNSFKIRSYQVASGGVYQLPVIVELRNLQRRVQSDYSGVDLLSQAAALNDIIERGQKRINDLVVEAQSSEDPNIQLKEAKKVRREMKAAEEMLENLHG